MSKTTSNYSKTLSMLNVVGLRESIKDLLKKESKYQPVASVCNDYLAKLNEGQAEETLCSSFVNDLMKVAVHESAKDTLYNLSKKIDEHKRDIAIVESLYEMKNSNNGYIVPMIESCLVSYMTDKTAENRTAARQTLSLFEGIKEINSILENLSFDEYEERTGNTLKNSSLNESMLPKEEKTYSQEEVDAMMAKAKEDAINENEEARANMPKTISSVDTHIELDSTIKRILVKESKNEGLKTFCEQYIQALNNGQAEEKLYESFISGISHWNYLNAVDTELTALNSRISKYQQEIDLKKILKIMESTGSYYIVPLIEGVIVDYVNDKSMTKKAVLKQRLQAFEYDPFVRDILNVVMLDQSMANTVYLGESAERLNSIVHTEKVFSPVKYIKENECVFNVKGTYYNRKGNTITKLSKSGIDALDESFKTLCNLINHPAVKIDDLENSISIYEGKDYAKITESSIELNGNPVSSEELANLANMSHLMNEHKEGFYAAINMINEKFDDIAYIDFVKRLAMNESNGKTVDVFRVKDNLFVNTTDANLGRTIFYRNVNPIQCSNYINEHMEINVSSLFEDILPNQHAILEGIEATKDQYETYLDELKSKKEQLEELKKESDDDKDIEEAIKLVDDEIADVEKDYKAYQEDSEKYTKGDDEDKDSSSPDDVANTDDDSDASDTGDNADNSENPEDNEPTESPEEMEQSITDDNFNEDEFSEYDPDFDVMPEAPTVNPESKQDVKVLRVSYDSNVKTGKLSNRGTAFVVIPSVDANGDIKDETKTVTFYLDPNRKPIVNNEYMPLAVYNAIVSAIQEDPDTASVEVAQEGTDVPAEASPEDSAVVATAEITTVPEENLASTDSSTFADSIDNVPVEDSSVSSVPATDEPMAGLEPDPEIPDVNLDNLGDMGDTGASSEDDSLGDDTLDSMFNDDNSAESTENTDDSLDSTDNVDDTTPVDSVDQEGPADTAERNPGTDYPIELGLNVNDIKPISKNDFETELDDMGIEHSESEADSDCLTLKFNNKAEVYALKNYFKDWKNYSDSQFCSFFPELKNCISNKPSTIDVAPANESLQIKNVKAINESVLFRDNNKGKVRIVLPYNSDYAAILEGEVDKDNKFITVSTNNYDETKELYETLSIYSAAHDGNIDEDAKMFLERYKNEKEFKSINESTITIDVPYNGFLEQKLKTKGMFVGRANDTMRIAAHKDDSKKLKKILESFYGENTPVSVKDFFQLSEELLNEGVKITIEDTKTGKKVTLDTDDIDNNAADSSTDENGITSDPFKDVNTTFETSESALFSTDDDSSDEGEDDKDDKDESKKEDDEKSESSDDKDNESNDEDSKDESESSEENKEEKTEDKPKKKFMFRKKKQIGESAKPAEDTNAKPLNESEDASSRVKYAEPNVLDWVSCPAGNGQIIAKLPMSDNFIINVNGRTVEYSKNQVTMLKNRPDTVECPYKYDEKTLKGLFEQMVHCGLYMNNNRLTPNSCFVKYSEYIAAQPEDDVRMVVENEQVFAKKKYIKVTEEVNEFANINDYVEGVEVTSTGEVLRNVLLNLKDFNSSNGTSDPVRVLVTLEDGSKKLVNLPASSVRPIQM